MIVRTTKGVKYWTSGKGDEVERKEVQSKEKNNLIFVRLFPNEDIHRELKRVCKKRQVETAVILSGLGQLKQFQLGYYKEKGNYTPQEFQEPHELLSLTDNISNQ